MMRRQKKSLGEIVVALAELNLPRESKSFLFRYALQHRYEGTYRGRELFLEMPGADRRGFGDPRG